MKVLKITPAQSLHRDIEFLMKIPLLPNLHRSKIKGETLQLYKPTIGDEWSPYLLKTDSEYFLKSYRKYYENRFKVEELEGTAIPEGYALFVGQETTAAEPQEASTESEAE